jgi:hypothetical protein
VSSGRSGTLSLAEILWLYHVKTHRALHACERGTRNEPRRTSCNICNGRANCRVLPPPLPASALELVSIAAMTTLSTSLFLSSHGMHSPGG